MKAARITLEFLEKHLKGGTQPAEGKKAFNK